MAEVKQVTAVVAGQTYTLTLNSTSGKWETSITAPSLSSFNQEGGYYNVALTATDTAGNITTANSSHTTLGDSCKLSVKEKVKPTVVIISPGSGAYITNNKPTLTFQLRDNDSGIKISSLQFKIDNGVAIAHNAPGMTCTAVAGGYNVSYVVQSALGEGSHTISICTSDNDGNIGDVASRAFKIDTVPPVLNVTSPADGLITNQENCTIVGNTNDSVSSPVAVTAKINNVDSGTVTVQSNGDFSKSVKLAEGTNTIVVTSTDSAGKSSSITITVVLDTSKPEFESVTIAPNPVDAGATYVIEVKLK